MRRFLLAGWHARHSVGGAAGPTGRWLMTPDVLAPADPSALFSSRRIAAPTEQIGAGATTSRPPAPKSTEDRLSDPVQICRM